MISNNFECIFERLDRLLPEKEDEDNNKKGVPRDFRGTFKL